MAERKIEYQVLEHKADTGLLVKAPSLQRLYIDAALAMTDMRIPLERVSESEKHVVTVKADTRESLMVAWLSEVLFLFEKHAFVCRRAVFDKFDGKAITATLWGEPFNAPKHGTVEEIKAVTYHQLKIGDEDQPEPHFYVRVFLDL